MDVDPTTRESDNIINITHDVTDGAAENIELSSSGMDTSSSNATATTTLAPDSHLGENFTRTREEQELYPIAVLADELKNQDVQLRLNAIRNLGTIAMALGPQRTRDELIPFLNEQLNNLDDDEALLAVAEELANFSEYVGGPEYAHCLVSPLENLATVEEVLVRDKAVESLNIVVKLLNASQISHYFIPLLKRLSVADWFTGRISACGLYAEAYPKCNPEQQDELIVAFKQLAQDDTPMVKRAAAKALADLSQGLTQEHLIKEILPLFYKLAKDDQDTVRSLTVEDLIQIVKMIPLEEDNTQLVKTLKDMAVDKSWRVRYHVATHFNELYDAFGRSATREDMVQLFVNLIKDSEGEVKILAIGQAPEFAKRIAGQEDQQGGRQNMVDKILPCIKDLVVDTNQHVRAAVATNISGLAPTLGKELTIQHLLPFFLQLLKDDFPDVRLNIISKLENVSQVIGVDSLDGSILPAVVGLAEDKQWRVRLAIIEYIPLLASQLGVGFFDEKLNKDLLNDKNGKDMCLSWLCDPVSSIREAAIGNLKNLADIFGAEWAKKTILPRIIEMANDENHRNRMTSLFTLSAMAASFTPYIVRDQILPTVLGLADDNIPNVRFNVANSLGALAPILKNEADTAEADSDQITEALEKLCQDTDIDVRVFAQKALISVQN